MTDLNSPNNNLADLTAPILVKNAGMVLLSEYLPTLFRRMDLLEGDTFATGEARSNAVHISQYAVNGVLQTEQSYLPLNKLLCGHPLSEPVAEEFSLSGVQEELITGMILSLAYQWQAIGKTSVEGFRGNWLVRDGLLTETEDKWELVVESRPYDILIHQFPFSYSIIKYKWMSKALHVKWRI